MVEEGHASPHLLRIPFVRLTEGNHSWVKAGACVSYEDTGEEWIMCSQPDGGKKTEKLVRWHGLAKWSQTLLKGESGLGRIRKHWEDLGAGLELSLT